MSKGERKGKKRKKENRVESNESVSQECGERKGRGEKRYHCDEHAALEYMAVFIKTFNITLTHCTVRCRNVPPSPIMMVMMGTLRPAMTVRLVAIA